MKARPIRLGGVPIGVARPPIEAANATQSNRLVAKVGAAAGPFSLPPFRPHPRMPATIASIMAAVQVLEMKALISTDTRATAARIRRGRSSTHGTESTP
jgi:hypothetical protein